MQFTLTYRGLLPTDGNAAVKEGIRKTLQPQLKELWTHDPLSGVPDLLAAEPAPGRISVLTHIGSHVYAPVVCEPLELLADLDILMLRPERPGGIVTSGGDIDNKLKTLFDALSAPANVDQISSEAPPSSRTSPTFTLLQDDKLISRVAVDTDRLLGARETPSEVELTIRVKLRPRKVIYGNMTLFS